MRIVDMKESRLERIAAAEHYYDIRAYTEKLCRNLKAEDYVVQSMEDASPAKWHLAHTSWFFETFLLKKFQTDDREEVPEYAFLFNSYYNGMGKMYERARRGMLSRPSVEEIYHYRRQIDEAVTEFIGSCPESRWNEAVWLLTLGLHHEQQHQELLLTDLKHLFYQNPLYPVYETPQLAAAGSPGPLGWIHFGEGLYWTGHEGRGFAFDNEMPRHRNYVPAFEIADRLVTKGEYLHFIEDGGYRRPEFWLSEGWQHAVRENWQAPLYWEKHPSKWTEFTLSGIQLLDENEPVRHVSYFEADAYARWAGARLPSEEEWETASAHPAMRQLFGAAWQWTRSAYSPYPGFKRAPGAVGEYNGKFMCNQYVLRGSSDRTPEGHSRKTYRNFFAPEKRWQFTGIRLAKDAGENT